MEYTPCANPVCEQYRIQHKNMTIKKLELEKELRQMAVVQEGGVARRNYDRVPDPETGEEGLRMPDGEIITPAKLAKRMEIAASCLSSLQVSEKNNRQLTEENRALRQTQEATHAEMRRLERVLAGFERTRRFETFTDAMHQETLSLNEKLADQLDRAERQLRILAEDNELMQQQQRRHKASAHRVRIDDEDNQTASAYITSDGRVPPACPCNACPQYEAQVVLAKDPAAAFTLHMNRLHKVCRMHALSIRAAEWSAVYSLQAICPRGQRYPRALVQHQGHGKDPPQAPPRRRG